MFARSNWNTAILGLTIAIGLTGCASMADQKPLIDQGFADARFKALPGAQAEASSANWWESFQSPQLNTLVERALNNNKDLRATEARLRAAQASLDAASASFLPTLNLNAGRQENTVKGTSIQGQATNNRGFFTSASLSASYELDLWARVRNTARASEFQLQATQYELEAARISVAGQLSTAWLQWLAADQTVVLLSDELENLKTNLQLVELRFRQGSAMASDVLQQRQLVESSRGNLAAAQANRDVALTALSILMGQAPNTLELLSQPLPTLKAIPAAGIPAELLRRRPDVQQAWSLVLASDRTVAAAIANRFPQLSFRASFSDQTRDTSLLFDNWVRNISVNLVAPLFDGGARAAELERQRALLDQAVAQYQKAALNALADVDNALVQEYRQTETVRSLETQLELAQSSLDRLFAGYRNGSVNYLAILNAQQSTSSLRRNLINARQQMLGFRVALHRAISGNLPATTPLEKQPS